MSAMADTAQDWQAEAIDLKRQNLDTNDIAEAVGKSPSTVRKVIARARDAGELPPAIGEAPSVEPDGEGPDAVLPTGPYPGEVPPQDDPEHTEPEDWENWDPGAREAFEAARTAHPDGRDPLEDFRAEAGEAVGEMQERPGERPEREMDGGVEVDPPVFVRGTRQMALDFGENAAMVTGATLVLKSEKLDAGHFGLGDVISGTFTARIVATTGAEKFDKDIDDFVAKPTAQVALVTEIEVDA